MPRTGSIFSPNGRFSIRIVAFLEIGLWATGVGDHSPRAQGAVRNCALKKYVFFKSPNGSMAYETQI